MSKTRKKVLYGASVFFGITIISFSVYLNTLLPIVTGYAAKNLCSAVFVSGRMPADVEAIDLNFSIIKYTNNKVNYDDKSVTSHFLWGKSKAIYREGFGTTLLRDIPEEKLRKTRYPVSFKPGYSRDTLAWPYGDILPDTKTGINLSALGEITKSLINDNAYNGNAFAFMVLL